MATKQSVIYSTNPKMDTSGISAKVGDKVIPGGVFYLKALDEQASYYGMQKVNALTDKKNLQAAAKAVSGSPGMTVVMVTKKVK